MPYTSGASTAGATSLAFKIAWFGLAANLALLACYLLEAHIVLTSIALLAVAACIFVLIFSGGLDEHFNALRVTGFQWGMAVIALYLTASAISIVYESGYSLGSFAAGGVPGDFAQAASGLPVDGFLLAISTALAFHLGFAGARISGTRGA